MKYTAATGKNVEALTDNQFIYQYFNQYKYGKGLTENSKEQ